MNAAHLVTVLLAALAVGCVEDDRHKRPANVIDGGKLVECDRYCLDCGAALGRVYTNHPTMLWEQHDEPPHAHNSCNFCGRTNTTHVSREQPERTVGIPRKLLYEHLERVSKEHRRRRVEQLPASPPRFFQSHRTT